MRNIMIKNIKSIIERKVKGTVIIRDNGSRIYVRIIKNKLEFKTTIENLDVLYLNSYTSNNIAIDIILEYRKFIIECFFK